MGYKEDFEKAKSKKQVTVQIVKWTEEGQTLTGKVLEVKPFTKSKFEQECNVYTIDTDEGRKSCVLGNATDTQLSSFEILNKIIRIEYKGKTELGDGRKANQFDIQIV